MVTLIVIAVIMIVLFGLISYGDLEGIFVGAVIGLFVGAMISLIVGLCLRTTLVFVDQQRLTPIVTNVAGEDRFYLKLDEMEKYALEYSYRPANGEVQTLVDDGNPSKVIFEATNQPYVVHYQKVLKRNQWLRFFFFTFTPKDVYEVHIPQGSVYFDLNSDS